MALLLIVGAAVVLAIVAAQLDWLIQPEPAARPAPTWLDRAYAAAPDLANHPAWQPADYSPRHAEHRPDEEITAALAELAPRIAAERAARRPSIGQPTRDLAGVAA